MKKFFSLGLPVMVLALGMVFIGCDNGSTGFLVATGSVTFNWNAPGTDGQTVTRDFTLNGPVDAPDQPTLNGFTFTGWYEESLYDAELTPYDFTQKETRKDFTLYAWWLDDEGNVPYWLTGDEPGEPTEPGGDGEDPEDPDANEYEAFVWIEGGTFTMGSPEEEPGRFGGETQHEVTLTKGFSMSKYPVTQKEWHEVMGTNPSRFKGDNLPVEMVNWYDAVEYCNKRSEKEGLTPAYSGSGDSITCDWSANGYRLPTEAEWEYAARGGSKWNSPYYVYAGSDNADDVAWHSDNSGETTHPVGTKAPNALGLYDMSGNVWEWCWDMHGSYPSGAQTDPTGASSVSNRVRRGGSWDGGSGGGVRSAGRGSSWPSNRGTHLGFRLVRP